MEILIAEDEEVTRVMLQTALERWGYDVKSTCDGNEAWAAMQEKDAPQLAILDWMMPGMDGPVLCRKLREQDRRDPLYLILLTAKGERRDIVEGLEAGADDYVVKPYDIEELKARTNVGKRIITLQNELWKRVRFQGIIEMTGAMCRGMDQPLQVVLGHAELLLQRMKASDPYYEAIKEIEVAIERLGELAEKVMRVTRYESERMTTKSVWM